MTLGEFVEAVEARRKTITLYAPEPRPELAEHFATRNVEVAHVHLPAEAGAAFLTVREGDRFVGAVGAAALAELGQPPVGEPWDEAVRESSYRELLGLLADTAFASYDRRQMLATAREIEERAWRVGRGELHTGFQAVRALREQLGIYERLADELTVHLYAAASWDVPAIDWATLHTDDGGELGEFWFVVFDGGGGDQACALLAEERDPGSFFGFFTYEGATVAELLDYLTRTY